MISVFFRILLIMPALYLLARYGSSWVFGLDQVAQILELKIKPGRFTKTAAQLPANVWLYGVAAIAALAVVLLRSFVIRSGYFIWECVALLSAGVVMTFLTLGNTIYGWASFGLYSAAAVVFCTTLFFSKRYQAAGGGDAESEGSEDS